MDDVRIEAAEFVAATVVSTKGYNADGGSMADLLRAAAKVDCVIVSPRDNELFIDIDSEADFQVFERNVEILQRKRSFVYRVSSSKSGGERRHVYLAFNDGTTVSPTERLMFQAFLGSDRTREILGWLRVLDGSEQPPTVFFEKV